MCNGHTLPGQQAKAGRYICEPGNVGQFVQFIQQLLDNPDLLREMKINAKVFANENISEDKMNAAYMESITTVLHQGKSKGAASWN